MSRWHGCQRATMFRMNGQKIAPAFSALPPSLAVVCRGGMDANDCMDAGGRVTQEQLPKSDVVCYKIIATLIVINEW